MHDFDRATAFDLQAECCSRFVGFVGLVGVVVMVWDFLGWFKLAERLEARDLAQFFRRPSAPELAEISRR